MPFLAECAILGVTNFMIYGFDRMKAPSALTLALFHFHCLMRKVRRYGCLFDETTSYAPDSSQV